MPDKEYLPYKAINVFIGREYLEQVVKEIFDGIDKLTREEQSAFTGFFRKYVTVLGFRNPSRAPISLKIKGFASVFEEKDEVIPFTLSTWAKIKSDLAEQVKAWLSAEGWQELTFSRDFHEGEGFLSNWPDKLTFDGIEKKFSQANPKVEFDRNDLILMVLWISGILPKEQSDL